jgi:hypothetical protein
VVRVQHDAERAAVPPFPRPHQKLGPGVPSFRSVSTKSASKSSSAYHGPPVKLTSGTKPASIYSRFLLACVVCAAQGMRERRGWVGNGVVRVGQRPRDKHSSACGWPWHGHAHVKRTTTLFTVWM